MEHEVQEPCETAPKQSINPITVGVLCSVFSILLTFAVTTAARSTDLATRADLMHAETARGLLVPRLQYDREMGSLQAQINDIQRDMKEVLRRLPK